MIPAKMLRSQDVADFRCIGPECDDICCQGWDVAIDKTTYETYQAMPDEPLKTLLSESIVLNALTNGDADYALIPLTESRSCPLLTTKRLCRIQQAKGAAYLSTTCAVYPRSRNIVDGVLESSLFLSCPEAARLVLLNPDPIRFELVDAPALRQAEQIPSLDSHGSASNASNVNGSDNAQIARKPYRHSERIRLFILALLQNRAFSLSQRLIFLGDFCNQLGSVVSEEYDQAIPVLLTAFETRILTGNMGIERAELDSDTDAQFQVLMLLIEHLVKTGPHNKRFLECFSAFRQGLQHTGTSAAEESVQTYDAAEANYYTPFMTSHAYILENYLVNYAFRTLFPFGPQKSANYDQKPIFTEYICMILQYALIKGLLIGMSGHFQDSFSPDHCVTLIQSYTKVAGHSLPFLKQSLQFIAACSMNTIEGTAILIRNP